MKIPAILCCLLFFGLAKAQTPAKALTEEALKELYFAGLIEKMDGNLAKADSNFTKVIAGNPRQDAAFFELANIRFKQKDWLSAEINIKKAIAISPKNHWYMALLANIYKKTGNNTALSSCLNQLMALSPKNETYYLDKVNLLFLDGEKDSVNFLLQKIETLFGSSHHLTQMWQKLNADEGSNAGQGISQPQDFKNILASSSRLSQQKKYTEALRLLQKATVDGPPSYEISLATADIYQLQNKYDLAAAAYKEAFADLAMPTPIKLNLVSVLIAAKSPVLIKTAAELCKQATQTNSEEPMFSILYGDALYKQGLVTQAKVQYETVIQQNAQNYAAYEKLLALQNFTANYADAIKTSDEALMYFPNQAIVYYYRAFALHRLNKIAEAAYELKNATGLAADDKDLMALIYGLQAEILIDQQNFKEAAMAFEKAKSQLSHQAEIESNYAYYLALRGHNLLKAEQLAAKVAKQTPQNSAFANNYAFVLTKLNKLNEALIWQEKALKNNGDLNGIYLENYGDILFLKGHTAAALAQWQKAKEAGNQSQKLTQKINDKKYIK